MAKSMTIILSTSIERLIIIALISVEWSQCILLIIYNNRVIKSFSESELKDNLVNNSSNGMQPLV